MCMHSISMMLAIYIYNCDQDDEGCNWWNWLYRNWYIYYRLNNPVNSFVLYCSIWNYSRKRTYRDETNINKRLFCSILIFLMLMKEIWLSLLCMFYENKTKDKTQTPGSASPFLTKMLKVHILWKFGDSTFIRCICLS